MSKRIYTLHKGPATVVAGSDIHFPYQEQNVVDDFLEAVATNELTHVVVNGDAMDAYPISRFDRSPDRKLTMEDEFNELAKFFKALRKASHKAKIVYVMGNHEHRWVKLQAKYSEVAWLMNFPDVLKRFGIQVDMLVPYGSGVSIGGVTYLHDCGASGKNAVFRNGILAGENIVTGHTHYLSYHASKTVTGRQVHSMTLGWMGSEPSADYASAAQTAGWMHGYGFIQTGDDGRVVMTPVPVG